MLGEDDHEVVDNEPINPDDLFDNDIVPPVSPDAANADENNEPGQTGENTDNAAAPAPKKLRQINRLANLNDAWLVNPQKENIRKVNRYFEKIKFKGGKGRERKNLEMILQRYEYFAQQCYPKLCFKDFVEKVELASGKRTIKNVLQEIRQGRNDIDEATSDLENDNPNPEENMDIQNPTQPASPSQPNSTSQPDMPDASSVETQQIHSPPKMTDDVREMIRRKREEAITKRKQKLEESMNASHIGNQEKEGRNTNDASSLPDNVEMYEKDDSSQQEKKSTDDVDMCNNNEHLQLKCNTTENDSADREDVNTNTPEDNELKSDSPKDNNTPHNIEPKSNESMSKIPNNFEEPVLKMQDNPDEPIPENVEEAKEKDIAIMAAETAVEEKGS